MLADATLEKTREENKETLRGFTTVAGDYTDNIDKAFTAEGVVGDGYDKSEAERVGEITDIFNKPVDQVQAQIASAGQGSIESIPRVSMDEKITVGDLSDKKKTTF